MSLVTGIAKLIFKSGTKAAGARKLLEAGKSIFVNLKKGGEPIKAFKMDPRRLFEVVDSTNLKSGTLTSFSNPTNMRLFHTIVNFGNNKAAEKLMLKKLGKIYNTQTGELEYIGLAFKGKSSGRLIHFTATPKQARSIMKVAKEMSSISQTAEHEYLNTIKSMAEHTNSYGMDALS